MGQIESIGDFCPNEAGPDYGNLQFDERRSVAASLPPPLHELKQKEQYQRLLLCRCMKSLFGQPIGCFNESANRTDPSRSLRHQQPPGTGWHGDGLSSPRYMLEKPAGINDRYPHLLGNDKFYSEAHSLAAKFTSSSAGSIAMVHAAKKLTTIMETATIQRSTAWLLFPMNKVCAVPTPKDAIKSEYKN
jgi:hypothetical protein